MKNIFALCFIIFTTINIFSQNYQVTGQVADSSTKKPLIRANIILTRAADSKVTGAFSDINGKFTISNLKKGKWHIRKEGLTVFMVQLIANYFK